MNEFGLHLVVRLLELHRENEKLKKEVQSRRHQADAWRKRYREQGQDKLGQGEVD